MRNLRLIVMHRGRPSILLLRRRWLLQPYIVEEAQRRHGEERELSVFDIFSKHVRQ